MNTSTLNGCSSALRTWTEAPTEGILALRVVFVPAAFGGRRSGKK